MGNRASSLDLPCSLTNALSRVHSTKHLCLQNVSKGGWRARWHLLFLQHNGT
jgi:hypothetical protein